MRQRHNLARNLKHHMKNIEAQRIAHQIEALAHAYKSGHNAADSVEATHPELAREYRAAANKAKEEQTALKAKLAALK